MTKNYTRAMLENAVNENSSIKWKVKHDDKMLTTYNFYFKLANGEYDYGFKIQSNGEMFFADGVSFEFKELAVFPVLSQMVMSQNYIYLNRENENE